MKYRPRVRTRARDRKRDTRWPAPGVRPDAARGRRAPASLPAANLSYRRLDADCGGGAARRESVMRRLLADSLLSNSPAPGGTDAVARFRDDSAAESRPESQTAILSTWRTATVHPPATR